MADIPELIVADADRWRAWLAQNESLSLIHI